MTIEQKYKLYEQLLLEWNGRMNLIGPGTVGDIRRRHIDDSAQLANFIPRDRTIIDLGSGAGFPAVVLAILGYDVIAIEATTKKCKFLEILKAELDLPKLKIVNERVENALPKIAGGKSARTKFIITSRGFAPIKETLELTRKVDTPYALLKGENAQTELDAVRDFRGLRAILHPSTTGPGNIVLLTTEQH